MDGISSGQNQWSFGQTNVNNRTRLFIRLLTDGAQFKEQNVVNK